MNPINSTNPNNATNPTNATNPMNAKNSTNPINEHPHNEEAFRLLSELHNSPNLTQRELSKNLNISLGKTNYLIQQLIKKGIVKMKNFSRNPGKIGKVKYILTGKGLEQKIKLTYHFLKRKEAEYERLKDEWEHLRKEGVISGSQSLREKIANGKEV